MYCALAVVRTWGKRMGKRKHAKGERFKKAFSHSAHLLRAHEAGAEGLEVRMRRSKYRDRSIALIGTGLA